MTVCPAKEIIFNICKNKGHFERFCKSKAKKPAVTSVDKNVHNQTCQYFLLKPQSNQEKFCGMINAWS